MRNGNALYPGHWIGRLFAVAAIAVVAALATLAVAAAPDSPERLASADAAMPANFAHYRDAPAGFAFAYPRRLKLQPEAGNGERRVFTGDGLRLTVTTADRDTRSLRALADAAIDDPSAASETRNTEGSVVLVEQRPDRERAVKVIALAGERAAIMVVEGAPPSLRDAMLTSFVPVSASVADPAETDAETRYRNPQLGFSIDRPQGARVSRDGDDSVSFKVLGPANEPASEISDGFVLTVTRDRKPDIQTLDEYGEAVRDTGAPSANRVILGNYAALHYSSETEMGDRVSHWLYRVGTKRQYHVTATISGDPARYRQPIRTMLESLRFD